ncbi:hypothetical protein LR48_Vigan03g082000 [Vigna angularis]|uniref:Uncharacterized protein n=1 Tax=Phaseolus angularis TaxID=3914 RepID=A0A0L9U3R2_PHAAN|nr:hypothetical protein LR48_Vigan03g082000 [Vigna angularis]
MPLLPKHPVQPPSEPSTTVDEAVVGPSGSASKAEDGSVNEDDGWVLPIEKVTSLYWEMGEKEGAILNYYAGKWGPRMAASMRIFFHSFPFVMLVLSVL